MPPGYYYGYGPHFWGGGFGIFGFLWFLFVLFVIFAVLRFAFFGRRMMGGGWGNKGGGYGGHRGLPSGIEERMQDWHERVQGEQPSGTPPPPPDKQSM